MKSIAFCFAAILLSGCGWLPAAGPTRNEVLDGAVKNGETQFEIVNVDNRVVDTLLNRPLQGFRSVFGADGLPRDPTISVGDTIAVAIWETGSGTLFSQVPTILDGAIQGGSRAAVIPDQLVMQDGEISVPFADRITVEGHTALQVQEMIRKQLSGKTMNPQVLVTVTKSAFNTVTVAGEVVAGARVPLSPKGDKILDMIAAAGGPKSPIYETFVRLTRQGRTATLPLQSLIDTPSENIYVWPGDVLTLVVVPRSFEAFGATGKNAQINFDQEDLDLAQALGKSSGLLDERADPTGVFLLRLEPGAMVRALGKEPPTADDTAPVRVIYHFDLQDPASYFLAQRFPLENNDVLYVASAQYDAVQKFFTLLNTITNPIITGLVVSKSAP